MGVHMHEHTHTNPNPPPGVRLKTLWNTISFSLETPPPHPHPSPWSCVTRLLRNAQYFPQVQIRFIRTSKHIPPHLHLVKHRRGACQVLRGMATHVRTYTRSRSASSSASLCLNTHEDFIFSKWIIQGDSLSRHRGEGKKGRRNRGRN